MAIAKCRYCKNLIKPSEAYMHTRIVNVKHKDGSKEVITEKLYFCNEDHYWAWEKETSKKQIEKKNNAPVKDATNALIEEIMEQPFPYGVLVKKLKQYMNPDGYRKMYSYLTQNKDRLINTLNSKDFNGNVYNKLSYFTTIINNNLPIWKEPKEEVKKQSSLSGDSIQYSNRPKCKRRGLAMLEEDVAM